jgi:hypoxanthine phosphoribosyltransferase
MELNAKKHKLFLTHEKIAQRVKELSYEISRDFHDKPLVIIGILKGSFVFLADLVRELTVPAHIDFISVSSYEGIHANDDVMYHYGPFYDIGGKNVIIVEDIIDTGATVKLVAQKIKEAGALNVKVLTLLKRESANESIINPDYTGFSIKDGFVVGYGLDLDEDYRNLKDIYILDDGGSVE